MFEYKSVPSGLAISQRVVDYLEAVSAEGYSPNNRTKAICAVNDILQGRSSRTAEELLAVLEQYSDGQFDPVQRDIRDFLKQKAFWGLSMTKPAKKSTNSAHTASLTAIL